MTIEAHIVNRWITNDAVLHIVERAGAHTRILSTVPEYTNWVEVEEGTVPPEAAGIVVPRHSLLPLHTALSLHLGVQVPTAAEIKVLREWLAVERERVDRALGS